LALAITISEAGMSVSLWSKNGRAVVMGSFYTIHPGRRYVSI
jgi:hypothetical protein